jgi:predicted NUDIX family NTP pyrophosphohydrolase
MAIEGRGTRARGGETSAGVLAYRRRPRLPEFLLLHPGGPFWRARDAGVWTIPKGLVDPGEAEEAAARREFAEEVGLPLEGPLTWLGELRQKSGKRVAAWLTEADLDLGGFRSNTFEIEWPRGSGRIRSFPECDHAAYFAPAEALEKILPGQRAFIEAALGLLPQASDKPVGV